MTSRLLSGIYHFLRDPYPLHPKIWRGRLSPLSFRRFDPADISQCLEIYALNEPGRFPQGVMDDYKDSLLERRAYVLVAEHDGKIVASGGLHYFMRRDVAVLSFGLVHPEFHENGIGTALVLARLALLDPDREACKPYRAYRVLIWSVAKSIGFYHRFGFETWTYWKDKHGQQHPAGGLMFSLRDIVKCRELLRSQGINFPADEKLIPFQEKPDEDP